MSPAARWVDLATTGTLAWAANAKLGWRRAPRGGVRRRGELATLDHTVDHCGTDARLGAAA
jgi:hypothetical protein